MLALLDQITLFSVRKGLRPPREERLAQNLRRALALDSGELLGGLLALGQGDLTPGRRDQLTRALVEAHPGEWRVWARRAEVEGISAAEQQRAVARAYDLAPGRTEVLRLAAMIALDQRRFQDARDLGTRAWLRGASDVLLRAALSIATTQLGLCQEALSWATVEDADRSAFVAVRARLRVVTSIPYTGCGEKSP